MTVREDAPRELAVPLGDFDVAALRDAAGGSCTVEAVARQAIYYYVGDADGGRPGWPYPRFMRDAGPPEVPEVTLSLKVDGAAWERFERLADAQDVEPELLLRHAVLYFAADVDAGRVGDRLLAELR